ncbi:MAG: hypothetical protein QOK00_2097 [Thermoleophilaceae bacterium]|nr:hypothetical protein [Thermoleophilaceae bacterium]
MSRRFEHRLHRELAASRPPRSADAERRAWAVVRAAHAARSPVRTGRGRMRLALVAVGAVVAAALALTPAGAKMGGWIDDVVSPAPKVTHSSLSSLSALPAPGRLLVMADGSAWVVSDDVAQRQLGAFSDATWSPNGLFVAGARGHELVALDPQGTERWTRPAAGRVSVPRWSPDGYRIAYRSGSELRVVWGNDARDWRIARGVGDAPPAWKPLAEPAEQVLAFAAGARVRIVAVDGGRVLGQTPAGPPAREIWWAEGGRRLLTVTEHSVRVHGPGGALLRVVELPAGATVTGSALAPGGRRLALISRRGSVSRLLVMRLGRAAPPRSRLSTDGALDGVTWSIDGSVLAVGVPAADQWWFVPPQGAVGVESVKRIRKAFAGGHEPRRGEFPRLVGWCRPEPADRSTSGQPPCSLGSAP